MQNKAIIFDLDGTLIDTIEDIKDSMNKAINICGYDYSFSRNEIEMFIGSGEYLLVKRALKYLNVDGEEEVLKLRKNYNQIYTLNCKNKSCPFKGIENGLKDLKNLGYKLIIFSNKPNTEVQKVANYYFEEGLFSCVRGSFEHIPVKPNKAGLELIFMDMNLTSDDEIYYVGDSKVDMETGKNASIYTIGVAYGYERKEVLSSYNPNLIVDSVEELINFFKNKTNC